MFDLNILRSRTYDEVCVVCVGNIRVGGTGKTPMTEYLISSLKEEFELVVISLGYKRKTKGLKEVQVSDDASAVGDEPLQMKKKFPDVHFFVNKDRNFAIDYIRKNLPQVRLILLDDAFQYRRTAPNVTVLLTEYNRPYFKDKVIPYGRLREGQKSAERADFIVVTKCPDNLSADDKQRFCSQLRLLSNQRVFFSKICYDESTLPMDCSKLLFVAGIDNPQPAVEFLRSKGFDTELKKYPDHHTYTLKDYEEIKRLAGNERRIITTEKDAVRLEGSGLTFCVLKIRNETDNNFLNILKDELRRHIGS